MNVHERTSLFYSRVAGSIYVVAMALSAFTLGYLPLEIIVPGDAAATAHNLVASEGLFRAGVAVDLLVCLSDVVLAWAFYELLKPVDESLARLGAFLRVADAAIFACVTLNGLVSLRLLSGTKFLQAIESPQLHALARLFMDVRTTGLYVGFVFLGAGSAVFAYVLFRSRYVPRLLAACGVFASLLFAFGSLATLMLPRWFAANASVACMVPMFLFEVALGLWFLVKGVNVPAALSTLGAGSAR